MEEKNIKIKISDGYPGCLFIKINKNQLNLLNWLYEKGFLSEEINYQVIEENDFIII